MLGKVTMTTRGEIGDFMTFSGKEGGTSFIIEPGESMTIELKFESNEEVGFFTGELIISTKRMKRMSVLWQKARV